MLENDFIFKNPDRAPNPICKVDLFTKYILLDQTLCRVFIGNRIIQKTLMKAKIILNIIITKTCPVF